MTEDINAKLARVRESYINSLSDKITQINKLWLALSKKWDKENYDELHLLVHSMAGSAETFGFPELTAIARQAVNKLRKLNTTQDDENKQILVELNESFRILTLVISEIYQEKDITI